MRVFSADEIRALAPPRHLVEALRAAFRTPALVPARQVLQLPGGRAFLVMPAFDAHGAGMVKLVSVSPDNPRRGQPSVQAALIAFDAGGAPVAVLDGTAVTHLRTGAASALASSYLSRVASSHLVVFGTGALAPHMAAAHAAMRPIRRISICGRSSARALLTVTAVGALVEPGVEVVVASDPEAAVREADIVCCATSSATPVVHGRWLRAGAFVDLVGTFTPERRESDDDVVLRARIFVDTIAGALAEAGDLLEPMSRGVLTRERIEGSLADLATGRCPGRKSEEEIIVFKSVGSAIEDLAAVQLVLDRAAAHGSCS